MAFVLECFGAFQTRATFMAIFQKFPLVPHLYFFRKCGFWVTLPKLPKEDNVFCARVLLGISKEVYFLGDLWKISLGPPFAFFQKMRVLGDVAKIVITWSFGTLWSFFLRQTLLQSLHYKWLHLEDNDVCARVLLAFSSEVYFLGNFWKTFLGLPFVLFLKMQVLGDLSKIAISWLFGHFWSWFLGQNIFQSLHFNCILNRG